MDAYERGGEGCGSTLAARALDFWDWLTVWGNREPLLTARRVLWVITAGLPLAAAYVVAALGMLATLVFAPFTVRIVGGGVRVRACAAAQAPRPPAHSSLHHPAPPPRTRTAASAAPGAVCPRRWHHGRAGAAHRAALLTF